MNDKRHSYYSGNPKLLRTKIKYISCCATVGGRMACNLSVNGVQSTKQNESFIQIGKRYFDKATVIKKEQNLHPHGTEFKSQYALITCVTLDKLLSQQLIQVSPIIHSFHRFVFFIVCYH